MEVYLPYSQHERIYICADPHFGDKRGDYGYGKWFESSEHRDTYIIEQWNSVVKDQDHVIVAGDVSTEHAMYPKQKIAEIVNALNGTKILVLGNHDYKKTLFKAKDFFEGKHYYDKTLIWPNSDYYWYIGFWLEVGFKCVYNMPLYLNGFFVIAHEFQSAKYASEEPTNTTSVLADNPNRFYLYGHYHGKNRKLTNPPNNSECVCMGFYEYKPKDIYCLARRKGYNIPMAIT